ncbi:MAG: hypothetical protein ACPG6R_11975 [Aequoribacter sp.]|uniref:phage adaptor protein n=1 Tax=Aequoribacter sp. TaxID=2847771 RepID=UPI003C50ECE9
MPKTLQQLCNAAREEIGFDVPSAYASATDPDGKQMFRIANRQGYDLSQAAVAWADLKTEATITLVAATQSYALASDYRYLVPATEWDQTNEKRLSGPLTTRQWAVSEHGGEVFGLNWRYEIRGGNIVFSQTVATGDAGTVISYEYVSKNWARTAADAAIAEFASDTDTQLFDDDLFIAGLKWRLKQAKGFPFEVELAQYTNWLNSYIARDGGMRDTNFIHREVLGVNVPETGFGS